MTDTRTVEDDTSLSLNDETIISVSSILFEKVKKARRTRNDIARDVRSGGAGSDEGTASAVALSAR